MEFIFVAATRSHIMRACDTDKIGDDDTDNDGVAVGAAITVVGDDKTGIAVGETIKEHTVIVP